jgi:hypothetical protein
VPAHLVQILLLALTFALPGCHGPTFAPTESGLLRTFPGKEMLRTELYFGIARRGGGTVGDDEWRAFLRDEITPRFPDGLTVLDARGQWRGHDGELIRSRVVMVLYEPTDRRARPPENLSRGTVASRGASSYTRARSLGVPRARSPRSESTG